MANPANSTVQNLLPVQAYFNVDGSFNTFIGQGQPFYATANPVQSGLAITNSTINSTTIGAITPSTAVFSSGQVIAAPTASTDLVNKQYVDYFAAGLSWKAPCLVASTVNIPTLSGLLTVDTIVLAAGDVVLVKNQTTASQNGIYVVSATSWTRYVGADTWNEFIGAITFIVEGSQGGSAWYCTAQPGGTLGTTAINWANFSVASSYTAGTGLTLAGTQFSITPVGTAGTYGSASSVPVFVTNASGQVSSVTNTTIAINGNQITSGTIGSSYLTGAYTGITGLGTLANLTVTNPISGSVTGSAATATSATTATNIAGGLAGSLPYQSAVGTTALLGIGTTGQVLTVTAGLPSWATPSAGTVTSVSGTGTVSGITLTGTVTSTGSLTLGGTLNLSSPPVIGGTTPAAITGTVITANTQFVSENYYAQSILGGNLRTYTGTSLLNWDGGGSGNVTFNGGISASPSNKNIVLSPTGTGTVAISPAGALTINPTTASAMDNVVIGGTTPLAGTFTTLRVNSTISLAGSTGTAGYALISNGASAPTWQAISAGLTVTDDTTTNATRYLTFTSATSGSISAINTSSTELSWNPSLGILNLNGAVGALNIPSGTTAQRPASPVAGATRFNSTLNYVEIYANSTWQQITLTSYSVNYLIAAGGGGGGNSAGSAGGGGGAGGLILSSTTVTPGTAYTIVVGGAGGAQSNGSNSTGFTQTAVGGGGGGGGQAAATNGSSGGSGGGGGGQSLGSRSGGAGTAGQGNAGGSNTTTDAYGAGGGGGSAATGGNGSPSVSGSGGAGTSSTISGTATSYCGGGGGGATGSGAGAGGGGDGGGGAGGNNATANTGGGGGGTNATSGTNGGSGIVIISYVGSQKGTGGTVTSSGGNTIHTFTSSGTFTA